MQIIEYLFTGTKPSSFTHATFVTIIMKSYRPLLVERMPLTMFIVNHNYAYLWKIIDIFTVFRKLFLLLRAHSEWAMYLD